MFVVIRPRGEAQRFAKKIQKNISDHYNIYREGTYPELHLTVDKIKEDIDKEKAIEVIDSVVKKHESVVIKIEEFDCFLSYKNNFLVLKVAETDSLLNFAAELHQELNEKGYSSISDYSSWEFHITLISNNFAQNPLEQNSFKNLCSFYSGIKFPKVSRTDQVELWRFTMDPDNKCIAEFKMSK